MENPILHESFCVDVKQPLSGRGQSRLWFAAERQGAGRWEHTGWGENSSIWKVFSAQPGVPISSPFQFAHFPSNDSSRVITVLFTNEVWKMGERQGLSIAGSAGMHGSVSRRHRKHRSLFLGEAEHEWKALWAGRWGRHITSTSRGAPKPRRGG